MCQNVLRKDIEPSAKGIDIIEPESAEKERKLPTLKRILGLIVVVAPYALIGSYIVSLYV